MTLNLMKKSKRKYPLRAQTSPEMNNILLLHSEWLEKEGMTQKAKELENNETFRKRLETSKRKETR